jgi:2-polyprenyl-6-methoxyphenol hydroxylase-like FAD-dependent oxidoreductase
VHPLPPSSFQGGSQSVEDGASLAICLALAGGRNEDVPRALEAFQTIRFPRVKHAQEVGVQVSLSRRALSLSALESSTLNADSPFITYSNVRDGTPTALRSFPARLIS